MSITGEDTRIVFTGDGSDNSPYAIDFHLRDEDSVEVIYTTDADGTEVVKVRGVDYSIAIADDFASATLTLITTAPDGPAIEKMLIRRNEPATRLSNYKLGDGQPAAVSNNDFDVRTMSEQTLQEQLDRALLVAKGHPDANLPLTPINLIGNAGAGLIVNAAETDWELTDGTFIDGAGTLNTIPLWTPDGDTLGDSIMTQSATLITVAGTLTVNSDAAGTTVLGRAKIGSTSGNADVAAFAHFDFFDANNFAIEQSNLGHVRVNAPTARSVSLTIADNAELTVEGTLVNIPSNDFRVTLGDVDILDGALTVAGIITASSTVLTTAAGLLRHQAIDSSIAGAGLTVSSGVLSTTAGALSGSGTLNAIPLWAPDGDTLGDSTLTQSGGSIISSGQFVVQRTAVGSGVVLSVINLDNSDGASDAVLRAATGGTSGGDAYLSLAIAGGQTYVLGVNNSEDDKLVGSVGATLGTNNWLEVTTARDITLNAASGQTVSLAVNATEELQVSGTAVTIASNNLTLTAGDLEVSAGVVAIGGAVIASIPLHVSTDNADLTAIARLNQDGVGDCTLAFRLGTGNNWIMGTDNSDDDSFKIGNNQTDVGASSKVVITTAGRFGIGDATPTIKFSVDEKSGHTALGGVAIKLTNKTGSNTIAGILVRASTGTADAFDTVPASSDEVIGAMLEGGIADGSEAWIVVSGIAEVTVDVGGCALGDRVVSSATAGAVAVNNSPTTAVHFQEVGHCLETSGPGIVRIVMHLN